MLDSQHVIQYNFVKKNLVKKHVKTKKYYTMMGVKVNVRWARRGVGGPLSPRRRSKTRERTPYKGKSLLEEPQLVADLTVRITTMRLFVVSASVISVISRVQWQQQTRPLAKRRSSLPTVLTLFIVIFLSANIAKYFFNYYDFLRYTVSFY